MIVEELKVGLNTQHPVELVELVPASGGVFDVYRDGERIFSKKDEGDHADPSAIIRMLQK
ncbi:MAG: Rdx family protein [Fimbriimonadales bacterium]